MNFQKRTSLALVLLILCTVAAWADALTDFTGSAAINAPKTSVLVIDLMSGEEIVSYNAESPLIPASILKSVSTATLLHKVGHGFRYETPVKYTGRIRNGVLEGDLVVEASGDPSINTRHEPGSEDIVNEIVGWLRENRVRTIDGKIVVDESAFPGPAINPTWQKGDLPHAYGTGTHGFNFSDNASGDRSVADPAAMFRSRLTSALKSSGVEVFGKTTDGGRRHQLGTHVSAPIDEIMRSCMMRSDNQFAEAILRTVGDKYGREGSVARGAEEEMKFWQHRRADIDGVNIVDGSGLSRENRVTARFMANVLSEMSDNPYYASFFPLAGQEGTLRKFLAGTPLEGYIAMKTGSMNGIQCYAGYKLNENYEPTHIVVVMMNEMKNRASARAQLEKLLLSTFSTH